MILSFHVLRKHRSEVWRKNMSEEHRPSDIFLVRHGQSAWNAWGKERMKQGEPPPGMEGVADHKTPLTDWGKEQARQTGVALFDKFGSPAVIYYSPYKRTAETAHIIMTAMRDSESDVIPMWPELLLVEQQFGRLDAGIAEAVGITRGEFRELRREFDARRRVMGKFFAVPPDGESWFDVTLRTHGMLEKAFRPRWENQKLIFVSHSVTIATFYYHLVGRDPDATVDFYEQNPIDNCGIAHFKHNPKSRWNWDLVEWNKILWKDSAERNEVEG